MSKKNKILVAVVVGILTVGIAFGAVSIAKARSGNGDRSNAQSGRRFMMNSEGGNNFGWSKGRKMGYGQEGMDDLAKFLGINEEQIRSERESGKSLAEIAQANGKTVDELKSFVTNEFTEKMDALLKDGKITQEQYDNIKSNFGKRVDEMINRKGTDRPNWAGKGQKGEHKGFGRMGSHEGNCEPVNKP